MASRHVAWTPENSLIYLQHPYAHKAVPKRHSPFYFPSKKKSLLSRSPRLPGSRLRTTLHLLTRETLQVTTRHRITTLLEPLLAAESELLVLLLAFIGAYSVFAGGFGGFVFEGNVEEVCFVGGFGICALAFWWT